MRNWKDEWERAFDIPDPVRKRAFLRQVEQPGMPAHRFLLSQFAYIRKWVWCLSAAVFFVSLFGCALLPDTVLWLISGLTPVLALTVVSESGRSARYGMEELEMATRFSLRSVLLARLVILGLMDLLVLSVLLCLGARSGGTTLLGAALYIVTPFLLSAFAGLLVVRRRKGEDAFYACAGISVGIGVSLFLSHHVIPVLYQEQFRPGWMAVGLALLFGCGKQCDEMMKGTEELVWN